MTTRAQALFPFLAKPWQANAKGPDAFDCWHLARAVSRALFDRDLPEVAVPAEPTWQWMIEAIQTHPERANWVLQPALPMGIIRAADGALVLMARRDRPAHIGVWLAPERLVIHADPRHGVVCDSAVDLRAKGWSKLRFYEPVDRVLTVAQL